MGVRVSRAATASSDETPPSRRAWRTLFVRAAPAALRPSSPPSIRRMSDLWLVFTGGLLGSVHCVGMCGGFALTVGAPAERAVGTTTRVLYFTGKTLTYAVLGGAVGGMGAGVGGTFQAAQGVLGLAAGVFMLAVGLSLSRLIRTVDLTVPLTRLPGFRRAVRYLIRRRGPAATLAVGLLNGLLPCGLVYGMLGRAAVAESAAGGALTMAVFGLATVPALALLMTTGELLRGSWRPHLDRASGAIVLLLGVVTIWRALPVLGLSFF